MNEEWKEFEFRGLMYLVSNTGRILGKARGRELKQRYNEDGYLEVTMGKEDCRTTQRVHRIVATLFLPNPNNLPEVNHIDMIRDNNNVNNLEWCTHHDNVLHSSKTGKYKHYGEDNPNYGNDTLKKRFENEPELREKQSRPAAQNGRAIKVRMYDINNNFIKEFNWIGECCEYLIKEGISNSKVDSIRSIIRAKSNNGLPYKNYFFKFGEED